MFQNNQPDYYNDAVRNARVNTDNEEYQSDSKGKLLLISNLILISAVLGYFIYQDMQKEPKTEVMGVNYTVDIHEERENKVIIPPVAEDSIAKKKEISHPENFVDNSSYIQALSKELVQKNDKKIETPHQNRDLAKILENIDTQEFGQTNNVVKIQNEPEIEEELDVNKLANLINNLVLEGE